MVCAGDMRRANPPPKHFCWRLRGLKWRQNSVWYSKTRKWAYRRRRPPGWLRLKFLRRGRERSQSKRSFSLGVRVRERCWFRRPPSWRHIFSSRLPNFFPRPYLFRKKPGRRYPRRRWRFFRWSSSGRAEPRNPSGWGSAAIEEVAFDCRSVFAGDGDIAAIVERFFQGDADFFRRWRAAGSSLRVFRGRCREQVPACQDWRWCAGRLVRPRGRCGRMLCLSFLSQLQNLKHRGHRGSQRNLSLRASLVQWFRCRRDLD